MKIYARFDKRNYQAQIVGDKLPNRNGEFANGVSVCIPFATELGFDMTNTDGKVVSEYEVTIKKTGEYVLQEESPWKPKV